MSKGITYGRFEEYIIKQLESSPKKGSIKSLRAVFREFLKVMELSHRRIIREEFSIDGFNQSIKIFRDSLEGLPNTTVNSKLSRIRFWHKRYVLIAREDNETKYACRKRKKRFSKELMTILKENRLSQNKVSSSLGISSVTFNNWCRDIYVPDERSFENIKKLEDYLNLPKNHFVDLIWPQGVIKPKSKIDRSLSRSYQLTLSKYRLHIRDWPENLIFEFEQFSTYKTTTFLAKGITRPKIQFWRKNIAGDIPSKNVTIELFSSFFGWLVNIKKYPIDKLSLHDLLNVEWMNEFLTEYMYERLGKIVTKSQTSLIAKVISMLRLNGYYGQYPERLKGINRVVILEDLQYLYYMLEENRVVSRNTEERIELLLELDEPLKPILKMINRMRIIRDTTARKLDEVYISKQLVMLHILIERPLRRESLRVLKVNDVVKLQNGRYEIAVHHFKNNATHNGKVIKFIVSEDLSLDIDTYLKKYRSKSPYKTSEYFFIPMRLVGKYDKSTPLGGNGITSSIFRATYRHLDCGSSFGPHAFRHLVASHWLGKFPDSIGIVAELLNDSIASIEKNYVHKRSQKIQNIYLEHLDEMRGTMKNSC